MLFVLSDEENAYRSHTFILSSHTYKSYLQVILSPTAEIKDYIVMIDGIKCFNEPVKII